MDIRDANPSAEASITFPLTVSSIFSVTCTENSIPVFSCWCLGCCLKWMLKNSPKSQNPTKNTGELLFPEPPWPFGQLCKTQVVSTEHVLCQGSYRQCQLWEGHRTPLESIQGRFGGVNSMQGSFGGVKWSAKAHSTATAKALSRTLIHHPPLSAPNKILLSAWPFNTLAKVLTVKHFFLLPDSNCCSKSNNPPASPTSRRKHSWDPSVVQEHGTDWLFSNAQEEVRVMNTKKNRKKKEKSKEKESRSCNSHLLKRTKNTADFLLPYAIATKYLKHPFYLIQIPHE